MCFPWRPPRTQLSQRIVLVLRHSHLELDAHRRHALDFHLTNLFRHESRVPDEQGNRVPIGNFGYAIERLNVSFDSLTDSLIRCVTTAHGFGRVAGRTFLPL